MAKGSTGGGAYRSFCGNPAAAALLIVLVLAGVWAWRGSPEGRISGALLSAPASPEQQAAGAPASGRFRAGSALVSVAPALFASDDPPLPVRPAALSRMAAKLRDKGLPQQQAAAGVAVAVNGAAAAAAPAAAAPLQQPQQQPANKGSNDDDSTCQTNLVVVLTSHKTGTAQASCITELVEQRYVMQGASRHDHHPADLHAVASFAAQRLQTQFSGAVGKGRLYCPSIKMYSSGHHLPRLEDETCPGTLPCPCQGEQEQCLATEAGTIDIPGGNTTVVQVIREPMNVVLSAYQYHTQDPAPEEWLEHMSMSNFTGWMYAGGVPYEALDELGAHATAPSESFYSFLRRMPREQGIKLQFWMSAWELYGFARQHASLANRTDLRVLTTRFEDLQARELYNATATSILEAYKERLPQLDVLAMLGEVQVCHISSWNSSLLASHDHVLAHRNPGMREELRRVLTDDAEIAPRLCHLSAVFGYDPPECGASSPAPLPGSVASIAGGADSGAGGVAAIVGEAVVADAGLGN